MDPAVRRVALSQMLKMGAGELLDRAAALRDAPPVPPGWAGTGAETALSEQSALASALAPLRIEFDDAQWAVLGELLHSGLAPDAAAVRLRAGESPTKGGARDDRAGRAS